MEERYKHLGYYNDVGDIKELCTMDADEIVDYFNEDYGKFYKSLVHEEDCDIHLDEEEENIKNGTILISKDKKYVISRCIGETFLDDNKDVDDSESSGCYVDIYKNY